MDQKGADHLKPREPHIAQRAVWFTVVTFGTNWIALMAFMPLMFVGFPIASMIIRIVSDFVFLIAGILLAERIVVR